MKLPHIALLALLALPASLFAQGADPIAKLREREQKVRKVVSTVMPSVIAIRGVAQPAAGSGVIVNKEGLILTAAHVTQATGDELEIIFPDGRTVKGVALGANYGRDAGMARIIDEGEWPHISLGSSKELRLGQWVVSMGHPGGFDKNRTPPVRLGRVWSTSTMGMVGTDSTLVGGDSGGPLFDLDGRLVGIHSSIGGMLEENRHIPVDVYRENWDRLLAGDRWGRLGGPPENPDRPMLGVRLKQDPRESGVEIEDVISDSPALRAGLKPGDVIRRIGDSEVNSPLELVTQVGKSKAGDEIKISVDRGEETLDLSVKLTRFGDLLGDGSDERQPGERRRRRPRTPEGDPAPVPAARPLFGAMLDAAAQEAVVEELIDDSAAARAGVEAGDVILKIDDTEVAGPEAMADAIGSRRPGERIRVTLRRNGKELELEVELGTQ